MRDTSIARTVGDGTPRPYWAPMCGIAGSLRPDGWELQGVARRMAAALAHRGPDGIGEWRDGASGLELGHTRLAVLDLSERGEQPMLSASERYAVVFNGEIYNHRSLREHLEGAASAPAWSGRSDTETLIACIDSWGVLGALDVLEGMFAFAAWDRKRRELWLGRDRFGEKPLYYGSVGGDFVFASQLNALREHPGWKGEIDPGAVAEYFRHGHVGGSRSIHAGISRLPPGHYLRVGSDGSVTEGPSAYWRLGTEIPAGRHWRPSRDTVLDALEAKLEEAVSERMLSDVPLGVLLSGGIDSSAIVAAAQAASGERVRTFSVGFAESEYDESAVAAQVARHLGTEHTELTVGAEEALELVPELPAIWDEPFADASMIPTCLISRKAREHVTVCLAGDGGDELFGGYTRYNQAVSAWRASRVVPRMLRGRLTRRLRSPGGMSAGAIDRLPSWLRIPQLGDRVHKAADCLEAASGEELYERLTSTWLHPSEVVKGSAGDRADTMHPPPPGLTLREYMMYRDLLEYLPDDLLVKTDRATMSVGLEARLPFLDPGIVAFAWQLPERYKIRRGEGKWLLRRLVERYLPRELVNRPKQGFTVPIGTWLRGPLRPWAESLLNEDRLVSEGWLQAKRVRYMWAEHLSGTNRWQQQLWTVLMFQAWLDRYGAGDEASALERKAAASGGLWA